MRLSAFLILIQLVTSVFVAKAQDFEVGPVEINFTAEPGESQARIVTITNHSNKKTSFMLTVVDYLVSEKGETRYLPPSSTQRSCADWITISPAYFDLNPNEQREATVSILVPDNDNSTRWAQIHVRTAKEQTALNVDKQMAAAINVSPVIVIKISQSPKSNTKYGGKISKLNEVTASTDTVRSFTALVENTGDKIIDAKVFLIATEMSSGKETTFPFLKEKLLPGSKREMTLKMSAILPTGKYALAAILDYGHNNLEGTQMIIDVP